MVVAAAALAVSGLVVLVPTFNALSDSGITPSKPPFDLKNPPDVEPPDEIPEGTPPPPGEGGEGEMPMPPPPCNRTKRYTIFRESVSASFLAYSEVERSGHTVEGHEWRPNTTLAVGWGYQMDGFSGEFEFALYQDGERVSGDDANVPPGLFGGGRDDMKTFGPFNRTSLDDDWTFDWRVSNGQGRLTVEIVGIEPDCDGAEEAG